MSTFAHPGTGHADTDRSVRRRRRLARLALPLLEAQEQLAALGDHLQGVVAAVRAEAVTDGEDVRLCDPPAARLFEQGDGDPTQVDGIERGRAPRLHPFEELSQPLALVHPPLTGDAIAVFSRLQ